MHPIGHFGEHYTVPGAHLSEPSPQRTPVLFQTGTSPRGREFAARNAEVIFLGGTSVAALKRSADSIRAKAVALGRSPDSIKLIAAATVITAATEGEAQAKYADLAAYADIDAALALFSAWTGVDWSQYPLDHPLEYIETNASRSALSTLTDIDAERKWTVRSIAEYIGIGGLHPTIVGAPGKVADELERIVDEAGIDGFNIAYAISPGSFEDFVEFIVPELRQRGRIKERSPKPVTLRERLQGAGQKAASWRPSGCWRARPFDMAASGGAWAVSPRRNLRLHSSSQGAAVLRRLRRRLISLFSPPG